MKGNIYDWFIVYTKDGMEKKVSRELSKKQFETYCPFNKVENKFWNFKWSVEKPIFSGYVFVKSTESEIAEIKKVDGVVSVLYWLGKPAVVKEDEMQLIKTFIAQNNVVFAEKTAVNNINYTHSNSTGSVNNYHSSSTGAYPLSASIQLPTIGYKLVAKQEEMKVISMQPQVQHAVIGRFSNAG